VVSLGFDADGKRLRRKVSGKSKADSSLEGSGSACERLAVVTTFVPTAD